MRHIRTGKSIDITPRQIAAMPFQPESTGLAVTGSTILDRLKHSSAVSHYTGSCVLRGGDTTFPVEVRGRVREGTNLGWC